MSDSSIGPFRDILCWEQELRNAVGWVSHPLVDSPAPEASAEMWRQMYAGIGVVLAQYAQIEDGLRRLAIHLDPSVRDKPWTMRRWIERCVDAIPPHSVDDLADAIGRIRDLVDRRNRLTHGSLRVGLAQIGPGAPWEPVITVWDHPPTDWRVDQTGGSGDPQPPHDFDFDYRDEMRHCHAGIGALVEIMQALVPPDEEEPPAGY